MADVSQQPHRLSLATLRQGPFISATTHTVLKLGQRPLPGSGLSVHIYHAQSQTNMILAGSVDSLQMLESCSAECWHVGHERMGIQVLLAVLHRTFNQYAQC